MGAFLKYFFEDIADTFRNNRFKACLCVATALAGTILGVVFFRISNYNWWYCNRCDFVRKLVYGGFFTILLTYLLWGAALCALLCLSLFSDWTGVFCHVALFFASLYFGANCCALVECAGIVLGFFYILLLIVEQAFNMLCCFLTSCNISCKRTLQEAISDNKISLSLQFVAVFVKIIIIFLLLRTITALI